MAQRTCEQPDCEREHVARGLCSMHWKRTYGKRSGLVNRTCVVCERTWMTGRPDAKFCTDACKGRAYRSQSSKALVVTWGGHCSLPPTHPAMRLASMPPPKRRHPYLTLIVAGSCAWCGSNFCALTSGGPARYCTARCGKAAGKAKRELLKGQFWISPINRLAIYERDRWVCHLCRGPVDPLLVGRNEPEAPSLDHVECQSWSLIPDHSPNNLRLAHRRCNAMRGAAPLVAA